MEFGVFLNGYLPGPGGPRPGVRARDAQAGDRLRHRGGQVQLEVRLVRRAPLPDRVQPHVGPRGGHGLPGPCHRADPRRHRHHEPLAPGQPPGPLRRAGGHARPRVSRAGSSGGPAAARAATRSPPSTSSTRTPPRRSGTRSSARSPACGRRRDYMYEGESFTVPYPHNILPKPYGQGPSAHLGGLRQSRAPSPRPASWASVPSPSTSSPSTT